MPAGDDAYLYFQLILSFYDANHPGSINTAQSLLADFQSSSQAWTIASGLLNRPDEKVKFFGALTIIVKLNRERYASNPFSFNSARLS